MYSESSQSSLQTVSLCIVKSYDTELEHRVDIAATSLHSSLLQPQGFRISSRNTCRADMRNNNNTQQMSTRALLTITAWQLEQPEMEGNLAVRITPYPGIKLPSCQLQACPCWPHNSEPLFPASAIKHLYNCPGAGLPPCSLQQQDQE